jgi:hypothetical protein
MASGREPASVVDLRSYIGQFLEETGASLGAEDEGRISLRLLRFCEPVHLPNATRP